MDYIAIVPTQLSFYSHMLQLYARSHSGLGTD